MNNSFYDLDLNFPGDEPDPAKLPLAVVQAARENVIKTALRYRAM